MEKFTISENEANQRFDRFIRKYLKDTDIILTEIFKYIRKWLIKVNNKKKKQDYILVIWDIVTFPEFIKEKVDFSELNKDEKVKKINITDIKNMIIYEDDNWLALNKPDWISTHQWTKHIEDITMIDILRRIIKVESKTFKPMFCYRLDKDTSWVLIAWKNYESVKLLNELIKTRQTKKNYIAIIKWEIEKNITIKNKLEKVYNKKIWKTITVSSDNWQEAVSTIEPIISINDKFLWKISMVSVNIKTWRMHQIRVHLSWINKPVLWDIIYWDKKINKILSNKYKITRQLLHSKEYEFFDKISNKTINIKANLPKEFEILFNK